VRGISTRPDRHRRRRARGRLLHAIGFATHRATDGWSRFVDYLVLVPRAMPGLLAGLAFLWVFLFFPPLRRCARRSSACGSPTPSCGWPTACGSSRRRCCRSSPELEEAARTVGASARPDLAHVTLPLIRYGLLASWLLVFMIFEREYSTGVYLLGRAPK
jgi:iron(III) transport system permease protein